METQIKVGDFKSYETKIENTHTASSFGSGGFDVLATPQLVAQIEAAAYLLLKDCGVESVGTKINLNHIKATIVGEYVKSIAKVTKVDGRKIDFEVVAYCNNEVIGEGYHTRVVIDPDKFMQKLLKDKV